MFCYKYFKCKFLINIFVMQINILYYRQIIEDQNNNGLKTIFISMPRAGWFHSIDHFVVNILSYHFIFPYLCTPQAFSLFHLSSYARNFCFSKSPSPDATHLPPPIPEGAILVSKYLS
jgi:hypothetical protein